MTIRDYLSQAYRLDQRIDSNIREVSTLRKMMGSISSPVLGDRVQTSRPAEAPFVRSIEKIMLLEDIISRNMQKLFLNYDILASGAYRVGRNADLSIDEDEAEDEDARQLYIELDVFNYQGLKTAEIIELLRNINGVTSVNIT